MMQTRASCLTATATIHSFSSISLVFTVKYGWYYSVLIVPLNKFFGVVTLNCTRPAYCSHERSIHFSFLISHALNSRAFFEVEIEIASEISMSSKTPTKKNSRKRYPVFIDPGYSKRKVFICDFDHSKQNVPEPDFKNLNKKVRASASRKIVLCQLNDPLGHEQNALVRMPVPCNQQNQPSHTKMLLK